MTVSGWKNKSESVNADLKFLQLFAFHCISPLRAKLLHFKVVPASLSSPHDVYNAFCRSSTPAVKQGCSHSSGNQKLNMEKRPYLEDFLFQAISPTSHLMPEGPSKRAFYSEDFSSKVQTVIEHNEVRFQLI